MENKQLNISEKYTVSDEINTENSSHSNPPIKGVISIYDKDGNLVKRVNNMVVSTGRYLLYGLFLNYALYGDPATTKAMGVLPGTSFKLTKDETGVAQIEKFIHSKFSINFSYVTETVKTSSDMLISDVKDIETNSRTYTLDSEDVTSGVSIEADPFDLKITFKSTIHGAQNFQKFNQIYLSYTLVETDANGVATDTNALAGAVDDILFSRVIMDPVFIGADGEYSIYYSLYF